MEVNVASRKDLADAIQSYNDNDNITFISGAKLLNNVERSYILVKKINFFKIIWRKPINILPLHRILCINNAKIFDSEN